MKAEGQRMGKSTAWVSAWDRLPPLQQEACYSWQLPAPGGTLGPQGAPFLGDLGSQTPGPRMLISCPSTDLCWGQPAGSLSVLQEKPHPHNHSDSWPVHSPKAPSFGLAPCYLVVNENSSYRIWFIKQAQFTEESNTKCFYFPTVTAHNSAVFTISLCVLWQHLGQVSKVPVTLQGKNPNPV